MLNSCLSSCCSSRLKIASILQALYSWWQYELCDVFIELVKPVMARSSSEEGANAEKQAFRDTLWTCLDTGLRCACSVARLVRDLVPQHTYPSPWCTPDMKALYSAVIIPRIRSRIRRCVRCLGPVIG